MWSLAEDCALAPLSLTQMDGEPGESRAEWSEQADMLKEMGLNGEEEEACEELITALMLHFIIVFLTNAVPGRHSAIAIVALSCPARIKALKRQFSKLGPFSPDYK